MSQISGFGAPTDRTVGSIGDIYTNENNDKRYKCVAIHEIKGEVITRYYTWILIATASTQGSGDKRYVDATTGIVYELKVNNGKLTMEEV